MTRRGKGADGGGRGGYKAKSGYFAEYGSPVNGSTDLILDCGIRQFAYELMTLTTQTIMRNVIEKSVLLFEPRISLERVSFDMSREAEGIMFIVLDYYVLRTNRRSNMVYPFYLREGTDLENK